FELYAVIRHLFGVPSGANAEKKTPLRHLIKAGDHLREIHRVVFRHQADRGAHLELARDGRGRSQADERIEKLFVVMGQLAAHRERRLATGGDMRALAEPERLEAIFFRPAAHLGGTDGVMGRNCDDAEVRHFYTSTSTI